MKSLRCKRIRRQIWLLLSTGGIVLGSSCGTEIEALSAGINAVAGSLDQSQRDNNISFGDWLTSELNNL